MQNTHTACFSRDMLRSDTQQKHISLLNPPHKQAAAVSLTIYLCPQQFVSELLKMSLPPQKKKAWIIRFPPMQYFYTSMHIFKVENVTSLMLIYTSVCLEGFNFFRVDLHHTFIKASKFSLQQPPSPSLVDLQEWFLLRTVLTLSALYSVTLDTNNQDTWKWRKTNEKLNWLKKSTPG